MIISLTLLTCRTTASNTSPLNGLKTIALYFTGYTTKPCPGKINPAPILSIVVTAITNPYLKQLLYTLHTWDLLQSTYFPVHVPSTSVYSLVFTFSSNCGPKYCGCRRISCSNEIYKNNVLIYCMLSTVIIAHVIKHFIVVMIKLREFSNNSITKRLFQKYQNNDYRLCTLSPNVNIFYCQPYYAADVANINK